jgi:hypothetical protein
VVPAELAGLRWDYVGGDQSLRHHDCCASK